jgi:hypothetical protein
MNSLVIADFGIKNGVQTFRICGTKASLQRLINYCKENDYDFKDEPKITHVHKGQWTILLKIKIPVGVME